ncbi:MAG: ECF-type sigma factor [Planctomycetota bacterium]
MEPTVRDTISRLLAGTAGQPDAANVAQLVPLVYDELRAIAQKYMREERPDHTLQPTALVHEAYLRLVDQTRVSWEGRSHFLAIAARAMRRVLIDHARARARQRRVGRRKITGIDSEMLPTDFTQDELLEVHDALERLAAMDPRQAQVVEMRFFGGMTVEEIATALGVSKRTIEGDWRHAKAWLRLVLADTPEK